MEEAKEVDRAYLDLVSSIEKNPQDFGIQNRVLSLAHQEEGTDKSRGGLFSKVPLKEIVTLFEEVKTAKSLGDYYRLLNEKCSSGDLWYDLIIGRRYTEEIAALSETVSQRKWGRGLDIGTGIGNVAQEIVKHCQSFVATDLLPFLLERAQERQSKAKIHYVAGEAAFLPFKNQEFDLIVSNAVVCFFSRPGEVLLFVNEVNRILKPGGSYFEPLGSLRPERIENGKMLLAKLIDEMLPPSSKSFGRSQAASKIFFNSFQMFDFIRLEHEVKERGVTVLEMKKPS